MPCRGQCANGAARAVPTVRRYRAIELAAPQSCQLGTRAIAANRILVQIQRCGADIADTGHVPRRDVDVNVLPVLLTAFLF